MNRIENLNSTAPADSVALTGPFGFHPDEITLGEPTRAARLKWVVIVNDSLAAGLQVNAAVCVSAATAVRVAGMLGPDATDADGTVHAGLPWAGCTVLAAASADIAAIRAKTIGADDLFVVDMPDFAQETRVYNDYIAHVAETPTSDLGAGALSIVGPRNRVDRLVKRLSLLG